MKEGWTYKKLGEICNVINGLWVGKKEPFINIAVIRNTNFSKDCKLKLDDVAHIDAEERQFATRKLQVGDIIIEKSGGSDKQPVGRPVLFNIPNGDYSFSNFTATLRLKENNFNPQFLHYCLYEHYRNGETKRMQSKTTGLRNLDMKAYLKLPVPNIKLAEQERIVAELDLLSSIIDKKKAQLKELDQLAQSIFYTMFGDPITNEKGWEVKKLGEVCEYITDGDHMPPPKSDSGIPFLTIGNINKETRELDFKNTFFVPQAYYDNLKDERRSKIGDILYTVTGSYGIPIIVKTEKLFCFQRHIALIRPKHNIILTQFLCSLLLTPSMKNEADMAATGIAQKTVGLSSLRRFIIPLPPLPLQQEFASKVEAIERQKSLIQQSIVETQTLFDSRMDYWFD